MGSAAVDWNSSTSGDGCDLEVDLTKLTLESCGSVPLDQKKFMRKCATFPSSSEELLANGTQDDLSGDGGNLAYQRSATLPKSGVPVSAMKGTRAKHSGVHFAELQVKWSPDVYDPPVSSVSHTVNSYRMPAKAKNKKPNKRKSKGKCSSRSNGAAKNHPVNLSSSPPVPQSIQSSLCSRNDDDEDDSDCSISSKEIKCSDGFMLKKLALMSCHVGEAS